MISFHLHTLCFEFKCTYTVHLCPKEDRKYISTGIVTWCRVSIHTEFDVFWIRWMFQPLWTKVKSGLSNYSNEPHPQIHQHARPLMALPHSTRADKKWESLLLVFACLVGIIMNITAGNIGVWLLFVCHKLFDMYSPTHAPLLSHRLSSEVEYNLRRKGEEGRLCDHKRSNGWIEEEDQRLLPRIGISREGKDYHGTHYQLILQMHLLFLHLSHLHNYCDKVHYLLA